VNQIIRYYSRWYQNLIQIIRKTYYILEYFKHCATSNVIAGPGFLGFRGGLFNPGAASMDNGDILLLAKGQECHWTDAVIKKNNYKLYLKGDPVVIALDENFKIKSSYPIKLLNNFPLQEDLAIEDFRIFCFKSKVWVNHALIPIEREIGQRAGYSECTQVLSILDAADRSLTLAGSPKLDFKPKRKEKNWVYLEHKDDLYLFYSFSPYRILKLVETSTLTFSTVVNQSVDSRLSDIGGFGTMVSFSTNLINYDDLYWLMVVHQVDASNGSRLYYHWGVLICKENLKPIKITSSPLFSGWGARGGLKGICYVMSVIIQNTDFVFFCGEGDEYLTRAIITKAKLDKMWSAL